MRKNLDIKYTKACAFCSYWAGLANVKKKTSNSTTLEFDANKKGMCLKRKVITASDSSCSDYNCKF